MVSATGSADILFWILRKWTKDAVHAGSLGSCRGCRYDPEFSTQKQNSMPALFTELQGLRVTIDRVVHMPHLEAPEERPHPFVYFITIHNDSSETVTIKGRKWIVTDADGQRTVVEGDGVVGKTPRLEPGESFSYNSYHVIGCDSVAEGAFFGTTEDGTPVFTRIPAFELRAPQQTAS
jgi:ApaG protein